MIAARKERARYTYADYVNWPETERWELIDGVPYEMHAMAAPSLKHQDVLLLLGRKFGDYLDDRPCRVFIAPCDVRLNADKGDDTVVQPDLLVVCNPDIIGKSSINGAPDLVIEVLSPSNANHDVINKFAKYREVGVKEIWFVDPDTGYANTYKLKDGKYSVDFYGAEDAIPVEILPGFAVDMKEIFHENC